MIWQTSFINSSWEIFEVASHIFSDMNQFLNHKLPPIQITTRPPPASHMLISLLTTSILNCTCIQIPKLLFVCFRWQVFLFRVAFPLYTHSISSAPLCHCFVQLLLLPGSVLLVFLLVRCWSVSAKVDPGSHHSYSS